MRSKRRWIALHRVWIFIVVCSALLGLSCASFQRLYHLMQESHSLEQENRQEELLAVYREILQIDPENRKIREKYFRLQEQLARLFSDQVRQALKDGLLQSALNILEHHRSLLTENPPSPQIEKEVHEILLSLESLKYQAQLAQHDGDYIRARDLLAQVNQANRQDSDARARLDRVIREGKRSYLDKAQSAEQKGDWRVAKQAYERALDLSPDPHTQEQVEKSRNAVEALFECDNAAGLLDRGQPEEALEHIKKAASQFSLEKIPFCSVIQNRVNTAISSIHYQRGVQYEGQGEWEKALQEFLNVDTLRPGDPSIRERLEKVRKELGKILYSRILHHLEQRQYMDAYSLSMKLESVLPDLSEALDLAAEAMSRWAEALYRQGLYYIPYGFHANAWLNFSIITERIPDYMDARQQASEQWRQIQKRIRSEMTFLPFFSNVPVPVQMKEWNKKLFESLDSNAPGFLKLIPSRIYVPPSDMEELRGLIENISGGMAAYGWLEHIDVQHSVSTSFEPLEYTVKEKVINSRYFQLQNELRPLYAQFQSALLADGPASRSAKEIKQRIDKLEGDLAGMSPVMEVKSSRKASKKILTHTLVGTASAAFKVLDVRTMKEVLERDVQVKLELTDEAIDPIFEADFPGKSVQLPSQEEFKRSLLDKMILSLQKEMDAYLQQYRLMIFQQAENMMGQGKREEALELYADFLATEPEDGSPRIHRAWDVLERAKEAFRQMEPLEIMAFPPSEPG